MFKEICNRSRLAFSCRSVFLLCTAALLGTEPKCTQGLQVTSDGPRTVQKAEGESVTLGCTFTSGPLDTGELDIEWSAVSPDTTQKDRMLMSYTSGTKYVHDEGANARGLSFAARDPSSGDASLSIAALSLAHGATYQCKVKKSPGVDTLKISLVVMVRPSVPKCWAEGGETVGQPVSLHCQSARGSTPIKYAWKRESGGGGTMPATATQDTVTGEMKISNHSESFAGVYLCEVNNAVGAQHCRIILKANKPPNRAAVVVGTVVGSVLLIFIAVVFIGLMYWKMTNRHVSEKEFSNEIREDSPPPVSRHTSRSGSRHPRVTYGPLGEETGVDSGNRTHSAHTPSSNSHFTQPPHTPVKHTPVEYEFGDAV